MILTTHLSLINISFSRFVIKLVTVNFAFMILVSFCLRFRPPSMNAILNKIKGFYVFLFLFDKSHAIYQIVLIYQIQFLSLNIRTTIG